MSKSSSFNALKKYYDIKNKYTINPIDKSISPLEKTKAKFNPMNVFKKSRKDCISSDIFYIIKNNLPENYVIKDCLGQGAFGSVLLICDKNKPSDCKALKVVKIKKRQQLTDFLDEIKYGRLFFKYGLGPEIFDTLLLNRPNGKKLGIIVMEKIDMTLEKYLRDEKPRHILDRIVNWIQNFINEMCKHNLVHGDLHFDNIGLKLTKDGKMRPLLIDFGYSTKFTCQPMIEYLQLIRTVDPSYSKMNINNYNYLHSRLLHLFTKDYIIEKDIEKQYDKSLSSFYEYSLKQR